MLKNWALAALFYLHVTNTLAQSGDIAFWIPNSETPSPAAAQVVRNDEYVSIKLESVFAYYRSGFLENISNLVVASNVQFNDDSRALESAQVNKVWQTIDKDGDYIAINDHLAVLAPTTPLSIKIKVSFRGIGEDVFKKIFDVLDSSALKTALNLAPATVGRLSAITPLVQKFLAAPYTSGNPRQILDVEQSFVLYSKGIGSKNDGLREGYYVVISGREDKSEDLSKFQKLTIADIRLSPLAKGVEYREDGQWKSVTKNSYVVISVSRAPYRGEDETSAWFRKYNEAIASAQKVMEGVPAEKAKTDSLALWREGSALLAAELNYVQGEKDAIKADKFSRIKRTIESKDGSQRIIAREYGLPPTFELLAAAYRAKTTLDKSTLFARIFDTQGNALGHKKFTFVGLDKSEPFTYVTTSDQQGRIAFTNMRPGIYKLEPVEGSGGVLYSNRAINLVLEPREVKMLDIKSGASPTSWGEILRVDNRVKAE